MEIHSRHIGNQEPSRITGVIVVAISKRSLLMAVGQHVFQFLRCDGNHATSIIGYSGLLNYIQLLKFCLRDI